MREYFIVRDVATSAEKRRGSVPQGEAEKQPLAEGETLVIVTREEWREL